MRPVDFVCSSVQIGVDNSPSGARKSQIGQRSGKATDKLMLKKIISGAQTGADRAGLMAGLRLKLKTGGFIPKGRRTDEGPLAPELMSVYSLVEHSSPAYPPRTLANVLAADGTVIFGNINSPGSQLTIRYAMSHNKPFILNPTPAELRGWVDAQGIETLNVAGNRERTNPGITHRTILLLIEAFEGHI